MGTVEERILREHPDLANQLPPDGNYVFIRVQDPRTYPPTFSWKVQSCESQKKVASVPLPVCRKVSEIPKSLFTETD